MEPLTKQEEARRIRLLYHKYDNNRFFTKEEFNKLQELNKRYAHNAGLTSDLISPSDIIRLGQILTYDIAKDLKGKKIAVTNVEYGSNIPNVRIGIVNGLYKEWDLASITNYPGIEYLSFQDYWKSFMTVEQIEDKVNRIKLVADKELYATCDLKSKLYSEPTFFGSDSDRPIYYIVLE